VAVLILCAAIPAHAEDHAPPARASAGQESIYQRFLEHHLSEQVVGSPGPALGRGTFLGALNLSGLEVSVDTAMGRFSQRNPIVGRFDDGNYLPIWRDNQDGTDVLIYRRFDPNLIALAGQAPLLSDGVPREPTALTGASDGSVLLVGWLDALTGQFSGAFLNSVAFVTSTIDMSLSPQPEFIGGPTITRLYPRGHLAAWEEYRSGGWHIYSQHFDSLGVRVGGNVNVDAGNTTPLRLAPAAAGDTAGGYLLAWSEGDNTRSDIHIRAYAATGTAVDTAVAITAPIGTESYIQPTVRYVPSVDEYWIGYIMTDPANDSTSLKLRRLSRAGVILDSAADIPAGPYPWSPRLVRVDTNLVFYTERFDNSSQIRAVALAAGGAVADSTRQVNDTAFYTRMAANANSGFDSVLVVWQDRRSGGFDIRGRLETSTANTSADTKLNEEAVGGQQTDPALLANASGGAHVVFTDSQRDGGDIAFVSIAEDGTILARGRADDDSTNSLQYDPAAASDASGRGLVTWTDERADWPGPARHAAGRFLSSAGTFDSASFPLSASQTATSESQTDVAMTAGGRAAVAWVDDRTGKPLVYARFFAPDGSPATDDLAANDGSISAITVVEELAPHVAIDSTGHPWVMWSAHDAVTDSFHVLVQAFHPTGLVRNNTFDISPLGPTAKPLEFSFAAFAEGYLRVAWADNDSATQGIWVREYDTLGVPLGPAFRVSDSGITVRQPRLAVDSVERWVVVWSQASAVGEEIVWQRYFANNTPADTLERLSPDPSATRRRAPTAITSQNYLYAAWYDNATAGTGYNVRLSSLLYSPAGVSDDGDARPESFILGANYPNPFNPETIIRFSTPVPVRAELQIFNVLGRRVRVLANEIVGAGEHRFIWDGRDDAGNPVGSGVYFYRVKAGDEVRTRKMLLLR